MENFQFSFFFSECNLMLMSCIHNPNGHDMVVGLLPVLIYVPAVASFSSQTTAALPRLSPSFPLQVLFPLFPFPFLVSISLTINDLRRIAKNLLVSQPVLHQYLQIKIRHFL